MTTIYGIPSEVFRNILVPYMSARTTNSFRSCAKFAYEIVKEGAKTNRDEEDINLSGERVTVLLDGTVSALLQQKFKMDIFKRLPFLIDKLKAAKDVVKRPTRGNVPEIIPLVKHAIAKQDIKLALSLIPFDFNRARPLFEAKGECGLGRALCIAVSENDGCSDLALAILLHPNASKIPAGGYEGIGWALKRAMETKPNLVPTLLAHPNAPEIPAYDSEAVGSGDLINALLAAIEQKNPKFVKAILAHPNAAKISAQGYGLGFALQKAVRIRSLEIVEIILAQPNAAKIPALGGYDLVESLILAIEVNSPEIARALLLHPNAAKIPEDECGYGLGSVFRAAVYANNPEIAFLILSQPNAANISLGDAFMRRVTSINPDLALKILSHFSQKSKRPLEV